VNALIPQAAFVPAAMRADVERAADFARAEKAESTRKAYGSDFLIFAAWCHGRGVNALPATAESVAAFLAWEAETGSAPVDHSTAPCRHPLCPPPRRASDADR
jgi:hypothetical protein